MTIVGREGPRAIRSSSLFVQAIIGLSRRPGALLAGIIFALLIVVGLVPNVFVGPMQTVLEASGGALEPPSWQHWLGTDNYGRDMLNLLVHGTGVSLFIGIAATITAVVVGGAFGLLGGWYGGFIDTILMRIADFFLVIPSFVLAIVLAPIIRDLFPASSEVAGIRVTLLVIVVVIGFTSWAGMSRIIRAQVLSLRERPFVERSRAIGASSSRTLVRHILPNITGLLVVNGMLVLALAILTETSLSFIGLGDPQQPSWGQLLNSAQLAGAPGLGAWWFYGPPALMILIVILCATVIGNALTDVLDPRMKKTRN